MCVWVCGFKGGYMLPRWYQSFAFDLFCLNDGALLPKRVGMTWSFTTLYMSYLGDGLVHRVVLSFLDTLGIGLRGQL